MEPINITIQQTVQITQQEIDDIVDMAFSGGINYWVDEIKVIKKPEDSSKKLVLSEYITRGGIIQIKADEFTKELTLENLTKGITKYIQAQGYRPDLWDATTGDMCIQLALFDELVFG